MVRFPTDHTCPILRYVTDTKNVSPSIHLMAISGYTMRCVTEGKSVLPLVSTLLVSPPVVQKQQHAWMSAIFSTVGIHFVPMAR